MRTDSGSRGAPGRDGRELFRPPQKKESLIMSLLIFLLFLGGVFSNPVQSLQPPERFEAFDTPNDAGGSITLTWPRSPSVPAGAVYLVSVAIAPDGPFYPAAEVDATGDLTSGEPLSTGSEEEEGSFHLARVREFSVGGQKVPLENGRPYFFRVGLRSAGQDFPSGPTAQAEARGNLFNWLKLNNLLLGTAFSLIILCAIALARRRDLYIRRIAGLEALDEALGRATEMGRAVLFIHGLREMEQISTIAAVNILGRIARRTAEFDTALRVANSNPVVMAVSQETVKEAYLEVGRPDAYNPDNIFVAGTDQFSYAAAVEGMMMRERPAAHIMMGYFYAESLLLAETGATTGAIQIAGTDAFTQLPFFVTTCDYTLLGEELYAASAYLSREPRLLGSLKGQDIGKGMLIVVIVLGTLLASLDLPVLTSFFSAH